MKRWRTACTGLALALTLLGVQAPRVAAQHTSAPQLAAVGRLTQAATPLPCSPAQLRASLGQQTAGVGSIFTTVVLRNAGTQSCTLLGYPGVSLVDSQQRQIGRAASWDPRVVSLVTLLPGGAASTLVHTLNPGVGTTDCLPPSAALRIYPPGGLTALYVPVHLSECLGTLGVLPLVAGTSGTPAPAATPPTCSPAQLRASIGQQTAGAGSIFTTVVLRNAGTQSCTLLGYPGVSLVDSRRRQIGRAASRDPGVVSLVTLLPGGAASTLVHTLNPGVGTTKCLPPSAALRIYPPGGLTALYVPAHLSECLGTLGVLPVVAGTSGTAP